MSEHIESVKENPRNCTSDQLDEVFHEADPMPADTLLNEGGREIDVEDREIYNDEHWRGFFPTDHAFRFTNRFSPLPVGFHKRFWTEDGSLVGETTDADEVLVADNELREVEHNGRPYVLLNYTDLVYRPVYDLLLPVSEDLVMGKAFFGRFPYGIEFLTFGLTRRYDFDFMSAADHDRLWEQGTVPEPEAIEGAWDFHVLSNAGQLGTALFELQFENTEHGVDGSYEALDAVAADARIDFEDDRMQLFDVSNWHDEIRQVTDDFMVGKYCQTETKLLPSSGEGSLGYVQDETDDGEERLCVYYVLKPRDEPMSEP